MKLFSSPFYRWEDWPLVEIKKLAFGYPATSREAWHFRVDMYVSKACALSPGPWFWVLRSIRVGQNQAGWVTAWKGWVEILVSDVCTLEVLPENPILWFCFETGFVFLAPELEWQADSPWHNQWNRSALCTCESYSCSYPPAIRPEG